ncbi:Ger(x)C family spore germination protein [Lysinibacillus sp. BW-2-10]|uniref:Ger(x)C family spore germination protein n=1 Tax=Lysinibacillus sp. BW-2-10 TaxID=2590030 RepID=UPI00117CE24F|nr:Ger(x)C family spore germination protein [Lysinibacillus sp. BW-2-10]TSI09674.1 Ger(x)C family spore germination protein [Lysinibacillus sp. BW-2-10]
MKKIKQLLLLIISCILLMGCAETKILERISLVTLIGYDDAEDDKVEATVIIRQVSPDNKSTLETQTNTEDTSKGTRIKTNLQTAKKVVAGQAHVVLFGEKLAKKGLKESLHGLMMNSEISSSIYLAVVEGDTRSLIEADYKNITDIGQHVYNLIDHNVQQQHTVSSTLHEVVRNNYSPFRDLAIPILKKEQDFIKINALAIFDDNKMAGTLSSEEAFYVIMIRDKFKAGSIELKLPSDTLNPNNNTDGKLHVAVDSIKSNRTIKLVDESPAFKVEINFACRLVELHSNENVATPEVTTKLEKAMGKEMAKEMERIIKYTQEKNSDIFGFGDEYHAHVRNANLTEKKWDELYKNINVDVKVNVEIIRNGVFE